MAPGMGPKKGPSHKPSFWGKKGGSQREDIDPEDHERMQILESSQTLLDVLKGEIGNAGKASEPQSTSKEKEKQARGQKHS